MGKADTKQLFLIAGCNGAGKTTASYTVLPEILDCKEFVNADEIAHDLSPFDPHKATMAAGRIMLGRIESLLEAGVTFAVETTLSNRCHKQLVQKAHDLGYDVHLLYFWLESPEMAEMRVAMRVKEGGHDVAKEVIHRRYLSGIKNLFNIYIPIVDYWAIYDNSRLLRECIAEGIGQRLSTIHVQEIFNRIRENV